MDKEITKEEIIKILESQSEDTHYYDVENNEVEEDSHKSVCEGKFRIIANEISSLLESVREEERERLQGAIDLLETTTIGFEWDMDNDRSKIDKADYEHYDNIKAFLESNQPNKSDQNPLKGGSIKCPECESTDIGVKFADQRVCYNCKTSDMLTLDGTKCIRCGTIQNKSKPDQEVEGGNYAIKINELRPIVDQLNNNKITYGKAINIITGIAEKRGYISIKANPQDKEVKEQAKEEWKQAQIRSDIDCPECGEHHIDKNEWSKRLHKKHQCEKCNHIWKPYNHYTFGI